MRTTGDTSFGDMLLENFHWTMDLLRLIWSLDVVRVMISRPSLTYETSKHKMKRTHLIQVDLLQSVHLDGTSVTGWLEDYLFNICGVYKNETLANISINFWPKYAQNVCKINTQKFARAEKSCQIWYHCSVLKDF